MSVGSYVIVTYINFLTTHIYLHAFLYTPLVITVNDGGFLRWGWREADAGGCDGERTEARGSRLALKNCGFDWRQRCLSCVNPSTYKPYCVYSACNVHTFVAMLWTILTVPKWIWSIHGTFFLGINFFCQVIVHQTYSVYPTYIFPFSFRGVTVVGGIGYCSFDARHWGFTFEIICTLHTHHIHYSSVNEQSTFQCQWSIMCKDLKCGHPVPHMNPLTDLPRTLGLLRGLRRTPAHTLTHTSRMENITSFKSISFLILAVQPPPLHYLSFCLLMSCTSFFFVLPHFNDSCYLLHPYFFPLPLFFINFWLSLACIPAGVVWNARHFWVTAKQMQAPLLRPMIWTSFHFRWDAEFQLSYCKMYSRPYLYMRKSKDNPLKSKEGKKHSV